MLNNCAYKLIKEVNSELLYMERMTYPSTKKSDDWNDNCVESVLLRKLDTLQDSIP